MVQQWRIATIWEQTDDTLIPATPSLSEMDGAYVGFIEEIKSEVGKM